MFMFLPLIDKSIILAYSWLLTYAAYTYSKVMYVHIKCSVTNSLLMTTAKTNDIYETDVRKLLLLISKFKERKYVGICEKSRL